MLRRFMNESSAAVDEMIAGMVGAFGSFYEKHPQTNSVLYKNRRKNKVALVTGGGSGHEPLFVGFVGHGLADAAVCGNLYNAPNPESIYKTAKAVESGKGVLFVYGTYPGDKMNFDSAEEWLRKEGIAARHIRVHDDIISAPKNKKQERRGIAGDVFMLRIIGAACDAGMDIDKIVDLAEQVNENMWSIALSLTRNNREYLKQNKLSYFDNADYIEYGVGLHGERGVLQTRMQPVDQLVDKMYSQILDEAGLKKGDSLSVLVNGLGMTSLMELAIVFRRLKSLMDGDGFRLYDADIQTYCASHEARGFSITILKMEEAWKALYSAEPYSPYYSHKIAASQTQSQASIKPIPPKSVPEKPVHWEPVREPIGQDGELNVLPLRDMMIYVAQKLIAAEQMLSEIDGVIGDGDHGICIANGMRTARQRLMMLTEANMPWEVYHIIGRSMFLFAGGASGSYFGGMFLAASEAIKEKRRITVEDFTNMWRASLDMILKQGGAKPGEKTLVDSLAPAVQALTGHPVREFPAAIRAAEMAAQDGAQKTRTMQARYGRGKYVANRGMGNQDPGATTIWLIFRSMREYLTAPEE